jgi:hypothetical protein
VDELPEQPARYAHSCDDNPDVQDFVGRRELIVTRRAGDT